MNSGYYQELESKIEGVSPQHALLIENYSSLIESYSSYFPFTMKHMSVEEFVQNNSISGHITSVQIGLAELNISSLINSSFGASIQSYKIDLAEDYKDLFNKDFFNNINMADFARINEYFIPSKLADFVDNIHGDYESFVMAGELIPQADL